MTVELPRLVVAGTRSGVGKTTVAIGLMAALRSRGLTVSGHKVGPDFIDPGYHAVATGRPPRNLDGVLHGVDRLPGLLQHGAAGADVAVVEGVMGLFDGRGSGDAGSTAEVARALDTPVVLVVDAAASSRSVAAEVHGFATFDPSLRVGGVILNRLGSAGHEQLVRDALSPLDVPVLAALPRDDRLVTPSRHLGLVPAVERTVEARATVDGIAAAVAEHTDLESVVRLARTAGSLEPGRWDPVDEVGEPAEGRPRVAVAGGRAFSFAYTEHTELLAAAGAEVVTVDPLHDTHLPESTDALVLCGGFPEVYADDLTANTTLADDIRRLIADGAPVVAECGGLCYLCRDIDGRRMAGVLDATATFTDRLTLGYRDARLAPGTALGDAGTPVRGHEFHRTVVTPRAGRSPAWHLAGPHGSEPEGFAVGGLHASYLHASWVGAPGLPRAFVRRAASLPRSHGGSFGAP